MVINGFNIAAEWIDLLIALTMLYLTVATKPRRTTVLSVVQYGQIFSVVNIVLHIICIRTVGYTTMFGGIVFRLFVMLYYASYLAILVLLFSYIHLLSLKQRENIDSLNIVVFVFSCIYALGVGGVFLTDSYITVVDGVTKFTSLFNINVYFAFVIVAMIIGSTIMNRREIPRVLLKLMYVISPFQILILVAQVFQPQYVVLSITYVLPFLLCYCVFHGVIYDEVTGCQNKEAFDSHLGSVAKSSHDYSFVYIRFPRLSILDSVEVLEIAKRRISKQIRALEHFNTKARIYQINDSTYAFIVPKVGPVSAVETVRFVHQRLDEAMHRWNYSNRPEYRMIVINNHLDKVDAATMETFSSFLFERAAKNKASYYEATLSDYSICMEQKEIERVIVDIRNKDDLNDPRVITYVQPIYDVVNQNYHNAEALMRLEVNGRVISPDIFIPLAEKVGCIHTLTRIILNKVCKKIYEMQDYYVFDAVSVNVSLSEFMDYKLHDELIEIIKKNGVPCNKIRLEMTESMTSDEIEAINHNMEEFNAAGVHFYLDDFGTGYSNLERIVSLPFNTIKFDKSLLYKSMDDPILLRLIQNMVDVFKSHGLVVLVEGVENQKQAELSIRLGFEYIQGFNYAAPVPISNITDFFDAKKSRMA